MSVAAELWSAVERFDPRQPRGADGRWGGGLRAYNGVVRLEDDGDGVEVGIGNPEFSGGDERGEDVNGYTARLDPADMRKLHAVLTATAADGARRQKAVDAHYDEHGELPDDYEFEASGYVSGDGADVHYRFELDDPSVGVHLYLAAVPHSSDDTMDDAWDSGYAAQLDAAETKRLLRMLAPPAQAREGGLTALDLWRALEAWDAARHPRGPGGRFIKGSGGGGSSRPSLADAVRGTAAGGPKRQRADKGGMSVGDAVRSAARRSDSTGRPTQRTPAHHRAEGAHDVADEVERALADQGVPEAQRAEIAARARAVADGHGKRPSTKLADQDTRDLEEWLHHFGTDHRRSGAVQRELDRRKGTPAGAAPTAAPPAKRAPSSAATRLAETPTYDLEGWLHEFGTERPRSKAIMAELERRRARDAGGAAPRPAPAVPSTPAPVPAASAPAAGVGGGRVDRAKGAVLDAYASSPGADGGYVSLTDIRRQIGYTHSRVSVDQALEQLSRHPNVHMFPEAAQHRLTQADRDSAITIGNQPNHVIAIDGGASGAGRLRAEQLPPPPAPAPKSASKPRRGSRLDGGQLAELEGQLNSATSMDQAREHLAGLNGPQLRQIAAFAQVYVTSADPKDILIGRIVNHTAGRRLDAAAITRMTNRNR